MNQFRKLLDTEQQGKLTTLRLYKRVVMLDEETGVLAEDYEKSKHEPAYDVTPRLSGNNLWW